MNRNGQIDGYEDWRLPVDMRIADLVLRMTLEEKVGLMSVSYTHLDVYKRQAPASILRYCALCWFLRPAEF